MENGATDFALIGEALDGLDRLYDEVTTPVDVAALLHVVGLTLGDRALGQVLLDAAHGLRGQGALGSEPGVDLRRALTVTEDARLQLAEAWATLSSGT